ncbi:MAG: nucleotide-binding universal stress UspA family protein [Haloarculaceae archaeon]|jgi:nucleotide-binding universal stress UspA family protein
MAESGTRQRKSVSATRLAWLFIYADANSGMRVLLGLGPDESALDALEITSQRASKAGDDLTVVVFGDPEDRERVASRVREHLAEADVSANVREIEDDPGGKLLEIAEIEEFDRIALPGGKRSPLGKIQLNSVAEFVLMNATTTVTLIR